MKRTTIIIATAVAVLGAAGCTAQGGSDDGGGYAPDQVEMVIPFSPGGGVDLAGRAVAENLRASGAVEADLQVTNMPGGSGAIGMNALRGAKAGDPDTLMTIATHVLTTPIQQGKGPEWDQLTPIARLYSEYGLLVVEDSSPLRSMDDLVAALREDTGAVKIGGGSAGSVDEVLALSVGEAADVDPDDLTYVPYDGGESVAAVLGGQLDVMVGGFDLADLVEAGELRALGVAAPQRLGGALAVVPTLDEQGVDVELSNWRAVFGPRDMPADAVAYWREALTTMSESDGWTEFIETNGFVDDFETEDLDVFLEEQDAQYRSTLGVE